jgi:hypothetical protein
MFKSAWDFLTRWELNLGGVSVKYTKDEKHERPQDLLDELTHMLERTISDMGNAKDGILVLIDEADKPAASCNLGEFAKLSTERLTKRGAMRVALGLAGLPILIEKLQQSHESSPRIFQVLTLRPFRLLSEYKLSEKD